MLLWNNFSIKKKEKGERFEWIRIWTIWFHIVRVLSTKASIVHVDRQIPIHVAIKVAT